MKLGYTVGALTAAIAASLLTAAPGVDGATPEGPLRIYSSLPLQRGWRPESLDIVRAERMALEEAGSTAAGHPIEFVSLDDSTRRAGKWTVGRTAANAALAAFD